MEVNSFDLIGFDLFGVDLNSIDINTDNSINVKDDYIPTIIKPYIAGHITGGSSTFTFKVNNQDITVAVDNSGNWKWKIDREINISADFSGSPTIIEIGIINLFEAVTANNVILVFHQNVWNMIMREIDVQGSPIQVAYQNMIDNYDVTIANASFDAEIEYLESSGTQYIDTGVIPNKNLSFDIEFQNSYVDDGGFGYGNVFGSRKGSANNEYQLTNYDDLTISIGYRNSNKGATIEKRHIVFDGNNIVTIDGVQSVITTADINAENRSIYLFGINQDGSIAQRQKGKIYRVKFGNVVDFIPVRKGQVGYMYDKVSGNLFGNSDTGNFILGNDK